MKRPSPWSLLLRAFLAASLTATAASGLEPPRSAMSFRDREQHPSVPPAGQGAFDPVSSTAFGDRAIVVAWHTFLGKPSIPTDFSLDELGKQLDAILALGYRFVGIEDAIFGRIEGRLNIVATIDDGHRTVPEAYRKVFAPRGIAPAIFVYPAIIGSVDYAMDAAQVRALRDSGCFVGAHGYHHLFVTEDLYRGDRAAFDQEIYRAKAKVEDLTTLAAYAYAYPFGILSDVTRREVERAGYAFAFAVRTGFVYGASRLNSPFELPRVVVTRDRWPALYSLLVRNAAEASAMKAALDGASGPAPNGSAKKMAPGQGG
jgi:peptidoglycan/xylan/chitin deacetylase (PgdA/CDA1 family)